MVPLYRIQIPQQPIRIPEIGGGTCGTSLYVVAAFAALNIPVEYTLSDISASFVSAAKTGLWHYMFVKHCTLDVTAVPPTNLQGHYDMIIVTNVIYATADVRCSASHARQMLRSDGLFTPVEYSRDFYLLDVVFGQLDG